jgi:hypothetical protein
MVFYNYNIKFSTAPNAPKVALNTQCHRSNVELSLLLSGPLAGCMSNVIA